MKEEKSWWVLVKEKDILQRLFFLQKPFIQLNTRPFEGVKHVIIIIKNNNNNNMFEPEKPY